MSDYQNFDNEKINEIANEINIKEYFDSQGINYVKRSGENYYYHCRNNNDSDASLCVNNTYNYYKCFSCQRGGGNILNYFVNEENLSFPEACRKVLKISGKDIKNIIVPNSFSFFNKIKNKELGTSNDTNSRVYMQWSDYEQFSDEPADVWINEGINAETQKIFKVRIDHKANRIVYPLWDKELKFITCKGRSLFPQYKKLGLPKYISYSKIGKMDFFCGWKENKDNILQNGTVYIFEGIKSVMKCYQSGIRNTICAETSSINKWQQEFLLQQNNIRNIYICFDSDKSYNDVVTHIEMLPKFFNVYIVLDRWKLLGDKCSPIDCGLNNFITLRDNAIRIK